MRIGLALNCTVKPSTFHRKNYFYPDLSKAYQITQYDEPLNVDGFLMLPGGVRIGVERAHMEEDTGKSTHFGGAGGRIHGSDYSLIDFNRAGVPLVEIVSHPDVRTAEQARQYVNELRAILVAVGASDAKMEEGSMRCDANVSVRKYGAELGTRCEIKNVNSVRSLGKAIEYEARRQIDVLETGGTIRQETRHWDETDGRTHTLRAKVDANDYRYFLEPDLVPVTVSTEQIAAIRGAMGDPPAVLRQALADTWKISAYDSDVLVNQGRDLVAYFEELATLTGDGKVASNWMQQDVLRTLNERGGTITGFPVRPAAVAEIIGRITQGDFDTSRGREIFATVLETGTSVADAVAGLGIAAVGDDELEALCRELLAANPKIVADVQGGKEQAAAGLIGQAKKKNPNVNPGKVRATCLELIRQMG